MVTVSGSNFSFFQLRVKPVQDNPESSFPESVLMQGKNKGHYLFYLIVSFWKKIIPFERLPSVVFIYHVYMNILY